jgi:hypothetical protein
VSRADSCPACRPRLAACLRSGAACRAGLARRDPGPHHRPAAVATAVRCSLRTSACAQARNRSPRLRSGCSWQRLRAARHPRAACHALVRMGSETSQASMRLCSDSRVEARQPRGHARNERPQTGAGGMGVGFDDRPRTSACARARNRSPRLRSGCSWHQSRVLLHAPRTRGLALRRTCWREVRAVFAVE